MTPFSLLFIRHRNCCLLDCRVTDSVTSYLITYPVEVYTVVNFNTDTIEASSNSLSSFSSIKLLSAEHFTDLTAKLLLCWTLHWPYCQAPSLLNASLISLSSFFSAECFTDLIIRLLAAEGFTDLTVRLLAAEGFTDAMAPNNCNMYKHWDWLVNLAEVTSKKDLQDLMISDFFKPYFEELFVKVIELKQAQAVKDDVTSFCTSNLSSVQKVLINRQKEDQCKYSAQHSNKRNWQPLDYYAWFLYCVWSENMKNCDSLFFNITLTANKVNKIIWQLLQYAFFNQCSSCQKTFTDVKTMNLTSKKKSAKLEKTQETVQNISEDSDLTELTEILKIFDNQSVSQVKDKEAQTSVLIIKSEQ